MSKEVLKVLVEYNNQQFKVKLSESGKALREVSKATRETQKQVSDLDKTVSTSEVALGKFAKGIQEMSRQLEKLSKVTLSSIDNINGLAGALSKIGKVTLSSIDNINSLAGALSKIGKVTLSSIGNIDDLAEALSKIGRIQASPPRVIEESQRSARQARTEVERLDATIRRLESRRATPQEIVTKNQSRLGELGATAPPESDTAAWRRHRIEVLRAEEAIVAAQKKIQAASEAATRASERQATQAEKSAEIAARATARQANQAEKAAEAAIRQIARLDAEIQRAQQRRFTPAQKVASGQATLGRLESNAPSQSDTLAWKRHQLAVQNAHNAIADAQRRLATEAARSQATIRREARATETEMTRLAAKIERMENAANPELSFSRAQSRLSSLQAAQPPRQSGLTWTRWRAQVLEAEGDFARAQTRMRAQMGRTAGSFASFRDAAAAGLGGLAVAGAIGVQAFNLANLGLSAERTALKFLTLSGNAGAASNNLDALMIAADNAITKMEAQSIAANLLSMNLVQSDEGLQRFVRMAAMLRKESESVAESVENMALMFANTSFMRLDSFGISATAVREEMARLSITMGDLDRQQLFTMATMNIADEKIRILEDAGIRAGSGVDVLKASIGDLAVTIGAQMAPALETSSSRLATLVEQLDQYIATSAMMEEVRAKARSSSTGENGFAAVGEFAPEGLGASFLNHIADIQILNDNLGVLQESLILVAEESGLSAEQMLRLAESEGLTSEVTSQLLNGFLELASAEQMTLLEAENLAAQFDLLNMATESGIALTAQGSLAFIDLALNQGMSAQEAINAATQYGILTGETATLTGASGAAQQQFLQLALQERMTAGETISLGQKFGILGSDTQTLTSMTLQQQIALVQLMVQSGMTAAQSLDLAQKFGVTSQSAAILAGYATATESSLKGVAQAEALAAAQAANTTNEIGRLSASMSAAEQRANALRDALNRVAVARAQASAAQGAQLAREKRDEARAKMDQARKQVTSSMKNPGGVISPMDNVAYKQAQAEYEESQNAYKSAMDRFTSERDNIRNLEADAVKAARQASAEQDPQYALQIARTELDRVQRNAPSSGSLSGAAGYELQLREAQEAHDEALKTISDEEGDARKAQEKALKKINDERERAQAKIAADQERLQRAEIQLNGPEFELNVARDNLASHRQSRPHVGSTHFTSWRADEAELEVKLKNALERQQSELERSQKAVEKAASDAEKEATRAQKAVEKAASDAEKEATRAQNEMEKANSRIARALETRDPNLALSNARAKVSTLRGSEPQRGGGVEYKAWQADLLEAENAVAKMEANVTKAANTSAAQANKDATRVENEMERANERIARALESRDPNLALSNARAKVTSLRSSEPQSKGGLEHNEWLADLLEAENSVAKLEARFSSEQDRIAKAAETGASRIEDEKRRANERITRALEGRDSNLALSNARSRVETLRGSEPSSVGTVEHQSWQADLLEAEDKLTAMEERLTREQARIQAKVESDAARIEKEVERANQRVKAIRARNDSAFALETAEQDLNSLKANPPSESDRAAYAGWEADLVDQEQKVRAAHERIANEQQRHQRDIEAAQSRLDSILSKNSPEHGLSVAREELEKLRSVSPDESDKKAWLDWKANVLQAEDEVKAALQRIADENKKQADAAAKAWEKKLSDAKSAVSGGIDMSSSVTEDDLLRAKHGMYEDKVVESTRRLDMMIADPANNLYQGEFKELAGMAGVQLQLAAMDLKDEILNFQKVEYLNEDAILKNAREAIIGSRNKEALTERLAIQLINEGGFSEAEVSMGLGLTPDQSSPQTDKRGKEAGAGKMLLAKTLVEQLQTGMEQNDALVTIGKTMRGHITKGIMAPDDIDLANQLRNVYQELGATISSEFADHLVNSMTADVQKREKEIVSTGKKFGVYMAQGIDQGLIGGGFGESVVTHITNNVLEALASSF